MYIYIFIIVLFYINIFFRKQLMRQKKSRKVVNLLKTHPHTYIITDNFWGPHGLSETLSRHIIDIEDSVRLSYIFSQLNVEPVEIIIHSTGASVASSDVMLRII